MWFDIDLLKLNVNEIKNTNSKAINNFKGRDKIWFYFVTQPGD